MQISATIIPIFLVIFVGWLARRKQFMPDGFLRPANRLVFYLAIPAMIFRAISRTSFREELNIQVLLITLLCIPVVWWVSTSAFRFRWAFSALPGTNIHSLAICTSWVRTVFASLPNKKNVTATWFPEDMEDTGKVDTWDGTITSMPVEK